MRYIKDVLKRQVNGSKRGQSLVEMAIMTPILLLMFIGVMEVGWALRGYLVLVNVNRESARFGVKNQILDFSIKDPATVGYNVVLSHTTTSLSQQLPLEFLDAPNATIIMSHFVVDTGYPCVKFQGGKPKVPYEFDTNCNCAEPDPDAAQWFTKDDLVLHPDSPGYAYYSQTYGTLTDSNGVTRTTRLNFEEEAKRMALDNNQLNCTVLKTGSAAEVSANNVFAVETFYDQPQLVGIPIVSNAFTDPIPFYTHTAMRIVSSRDASNTDTVGPVCAVLPITFPEDMLKDPDDNGIDDYTEAQLISFGPGDPPNPANIPIDALEGGGTGQWGWLTWTGQTDAGYLAEELDNEYLALHDFTDANDPNDHSLSIGDDISGLTGVSGADDVKDLLLSYEGKEVLVPIYDTSGGSGSNLYYSVVHFARIRIDDICIPGTPGASCPGTGGQKTIKATFLWYEDDACTD